jgi:arsenate reductase (thioredoxin)
MKKPVVLFVCTGNSARSQMAEGLLRKHAGHRCDARSAGTEPKGLNSLSVEAMKEIGIDISGHRSKNLSELVGKVPIDYAIFVCSSAEDRCPTLAAFTGQRF